MQFFILVLLICLFVFLYCVYTLANDDFIFLRKDITMEKIFNIIFLGSLSSLFISRVFYGLFNGGEIFSNPLVFFLFPYFPGLSLLGGVVGGGVGFLFLATRKKNQLPLGRLADFFSIALLITLPVGFLGYFMFSEDGFPFIKASALVFTYLILFIIFLRLILPQLLNGKLKEGTITYLFLICFSVVSLISNAFPKFNLLSYVKNFENMLLILILFLSLGMLMKYENLFIGLKSFRKKK
ncbi:MAG: hypothetical protein Q8P26_00405 [Candidatus Levybacteria bacterium]|nr:hypothetical protein [Candidatus Levybacteria bacterium]